MSRRHFVTGLLGLTASALFPTMAHATPPARVVIIGGGWGGLATAHQLRSLAPSIEVVLIERNPVFWSRPLSNRWLVDLLPSGHSLVHDYAAIAGRRGYRFVHDEVVAIDRSQRQVVTRHEVLSYDWLVIAAGIRENFTDWFGGDAAATKFSQQSYPSGCVGANDLQRLKTKLANFAGGDLVMTIPRMPYRCPTAPYERAGMIAWWIKQRKIKGRLVILDANQPSTAFARVFRDAYSDEITYLPQSQIRSIDPYKKQIITDFDTLDFTDAILMPPQQAAEVVWQAGLISPMENGKTSGWATHNPVSLQSTVDEHIFMAGDLLDKSSPLFGFYPKTGQMAARQGAIVAQQIVDRQRGVINSESMLPASTCYAVQRVTPLEISRIDTTYRFRADGLIQQTVKQTHYPQAQDEDVAWGNTMFRELGI